MDLLIDGRACVCCSCGAGRTADASRYSARLEANRKAYHKMFYNGLGTADAAGGAAKPSGKRCCYDTGSQTNNCLLYTSPSPRDA